MIQYSKSLYLVVMSQFPCNSRYQRVYAPRASSVGTSWQPPFASGSFLEELQASSFFFLESVRLFSISSFFSTSHAECPNSSLNAFAFTTSLSYHDHIYLNRLHFQQQCLQPAERGSRPHSMSLPSVAAITNAQDGIA